MPDHGHPAAPADTLLAAFDAQARRHPERVAVTCAGHDLAYGELRQRAEALARTLAARGIGRGARVGIAVPRRAEMLVATLGTLLAGAAYVPLDPTFPCSRLADMADDARLQDIIVHEPGDLDPALATGRTLIALRDLAPPADAGAELPEVRGEDPAWVLYTSGSTGRPKGVTVLHRNVANLLESARHEPGFTADDVLCSVTTLSFDIAAIELYLPLSVGARIVLATQEELRDPLALLDLIAAHRVSLIQTTVGIARMLLDHDRRHVLRDLRLCVGGEDLPPDLARRLPRHVRELWNIYGPTETTVWSTLQRVEKDWRGPIPIGHPIAHTTIHLLDATGQPVPEGETGEIWISGAGVAQGYLFQPELSAERFRPDPFAADGSRMYRTGDLGSRKDGLLYFHGRVDHQIKLRGFRIELGEIEAVAMTDPGLADAVAVVRDYGPEDQRVVLCAVARHPDPGLEKRLHTTLRERLPRYMLPARIEWHTTLPHTPNGKIDRRALAHPDPAPTSIPNPITHRLAAFTRRLFRR